MRSDYLDSSSGRARRPRGGPDKKAPRGLGWKTVIVTILLVVGVVVTIAIMRLVAQWAADRAGGTTEFDQAVADQLASEQAAFEVDTDGDGLTDLLENIYRSDPEVVDTDGDGLSDFEEVQEGRDPTVAGPDDVVDVQAAQDLLATESYSRRYVSTLPPDVPREDFLSEDRIAAFIATIQEERELVPAVADSDIVVTADSGVEAVGTYLDATSTTTNSELAVVTSNDIDTAFRSHFQSGESAAINEIIADLENNVTILKQVAAPVEVAALHKKLVGASQALLDNVKLLERMPSDLVGGLLGAKNIEDLGGVFDEIAEEIAALQAKYGLE